MACLFAGRGQAGHFLTNKNITMNPSTLAHIIQQLIAAQEENDTLIEECARLNQLLNPLAEQPEIEQQPEPERQEQTEQPTEIEQDEQTLAITAANEEAKL